MTTNTNNIEVFDALQLSLLADDFEGLSDPAILGIPPSLSPTITSPSSSSYMSSPSPDPPSYIPSSDPVNFQSSGFNEINEIFQLIQDSKTSENKIKKKIHKQTDLLAVTVMKTLNIQNSRTMKLNHLLKPYNKIFKQDPKLKEFIMKRITRKYTKKNL